MQLISLNKRRLLKPLPIPDWDIGLVLRLSLFDSCVRDYIAVGLKAIMFRMLGLVVLVLEQTHSPPL